MAISINGTTGISGVDGSASAPALTGTDSNTGITFPAADTIKLSTGGVERMAITNSGVSGTGVGKVKQIKYAQNSTLTESTSSSMAAYDALNVAITPTSSSNLLLATVAMQANVYDNGSHDANSQICLTDDDGSSYLFKNQFRAYDYGGSGHFLQIAPVGGSHIKTAGSTSARTYKILYRLLAGDKLVFNNYYGSAGEVNSILTVMEIEP